MSIRLSRLLLLAPLLTLFGCTLANVTPEYVPDARPGMGVMVASLGRTGAIEFDLRAMIRPVGSPTTYAIVVDNPVTPKDFGSVVKPPPNSQQSDWGYVPASQPYGRLVVASLPAGDYIFASVAGSPPFRQMGTPFVLGSDDLGMRFTIRPGQITYLGSVVFGFPDWLPLGSYRGPLKVVATDTRDRDGKLLREHYPKLGADLPERSLTAIPGESQHFHYYLVTTESGGTSKN